MKRTAFYPALAAVILALTSCTASAGALCVPMIDQAQIDRHAAKLVQIARDIRILSQNKESLLVDRAVAPWPAVKKDPVSTASGIDSIYSFLSIFPVSSPVTANLAGIGEGKILGAVGKTASASAPGDHKAEPGVYMLFVPEENDKNSLKVLWVSKSEDADGKATYREVMRASLLHDNGVFGGGAKTEAFPKVTASIVVTSTQVEMSWISGGTYVFSFSVDLSWA